MDIFSRRTEKFAVVWIPPRQVREAVTLEDDLREGTETFHWFGGDWFAEMTAWGQENLNLEGPAELWGSVLTMAARIASVAQGSSSSWTARVPVISLPALAAACQMSCSST